MRLHQIFSPSVNQYNNKPVLSGGQTDNYLFFAYGSKNEIIIVDRNLFQIQVIGVNKECEALVSCVKCTELGGKIFSAHAKTVSVFYPTKTLNEDEWVYQWLKSWEVTTDAVISQIAANSYGDGFLVSSGATLLYYKTENLDSSTISTYFLYWKFIDSSPSHLMEFSTDELYFATSNNDESFVKIFYPSRRAWSTNNCFQYLSKFTNNKLTKIYDIQMYSMIYIPHPEPVTSLSWRRKSHFCNTDIILNVLLTSCKDGVARIWGENLWDLNSQSMIGISSVEDLIQLPLDHSVNLDDGLLKRISPYISFHTIVSINHTPPFKSPIKEGKKQNPCLDFFWLNNKETEVTSYTNTIFGIKGIGSRSNSKLSLYSKDPDEHISINQNVEFDLELYNRALAHWHQGPDIIFSISSYDGSFLTWSIDYLDSIGIDQTHSPTASFLSSISMEIPFKLAKSISNCLIYHNYETLAHLGLRHKRCQSDTEISLNNLSSTQPNQINVYQNLYPDISLNQNTLLLTVHGNGSMNSWKIEYGDRKSFSSVYNISRTSHIQDFSFQVVSVTLHPYLPLIIVLSVQKSSNLDTSNDDLIDLSVWQLIPILSSYFTNRWNVRGSLKLRGNCLHTHAAWIPLVLNSSLTVLSFFCLSTSTGIHVFQLLPEVKDIVDDDILTPDSGPIISTYGLKICTVLESSDDDSLFSFIHVFRLKICNNMEFEIHCSHPKDSVYLVAAVEITKRNLTYLHTWEIVPAFDKSQLQKRFDAVKIAPSSSHSNLRELSSGQVLSHHIKKFEIDSEEGDEVETWIPITDTSTSSFSNLYSLSNIIVLSGLSKKGIVKFIELSFSLTDSYYNICKTRPYDNLSSSEIELFKETDFDLKISMNKSAYDGLSTVLRQWLLEEKPISISYANFTLMGYVGIPLQDTPASTIHNMQNVFIVRIFENRLAGMLSWKQEACFHIPYSDIGPLVDIQTQLDSNNNGIFVSWCSLDNGNYILSICILGKIFIIAPNLNQSDYLYPDNIKIEFSGSSSWNIISVYDYTQNINHIYNSFWNWGGIFILTSTRAIRIYSPIDEMSLTRLKDLNIKTKSSTIINEVEQALSTYDNRLQIEPLNVIGLIILGKFNLLAKILLNFYSEIKESAQLHNIRILSDSVSFRSTHSQTSTVKKVCADVHKKTISIKFLKINQVLAFLFDSNLKNTENALPIDTSINDIIGEIASLKLSEDEEDMNKDTEPVLNIKIVEEIKRYLSIVNVRGLEDVDMSILHGIFSVCAELNETLCSTSASSLDECAKQYLFSAKLFFYIQNQVKEDENKKYLADHKILNNTHFAWALHSNSQDELCDRLGFFTEQVQLSWTLASSLGIGWWVANNDTKKRLIETIAKCEYQKKQDPLDSALFYLLLQRKNVISALYKSQKNTKMFEFFRKDFFDSTVQSAALKNAYYLLGLHRFIHAAVFLLLAEKYWDAVSICVSNLKDYQLGFLICQMCNNLSDGDILSRFVKTYIIGELDGYAPFADPFLRSMGFWVLNRPIESLTTIVDKDLLSPSAVNQIGSKQFNFLVLFRFHQLHFFAYLKSHFNIKSYFTYQEQGIKPMVKHLGMEVTPSYISSSYDRLLCSCIRYALNQGSPFISLILSLDHKLFNIFEEETNSNPKTELKASTAISSTKTDHELQISKPLIVKKDNVIDWSRPLVNPDNLNKKLDLLNFGSKINEDKFEPTVTQLDSHAHVKNLKTSLTTPSLLRTLTFRNIRFVSFMRILIEDIKNWGLTVFEYDSLDCKNSDLALIIYKNLRIFELSCVEDYFETNFNPATVANDLMLIKEADVSYFDLYSFLNKYHFIMILLQRHFSLYNFLHIKIVLELIIILSETEAFSIKQHTNNVNYVFLHYSNMPTLVSNTPGKSPITDIQSFVSSLTELIVNEIIKLNTDIFLMEKKSQLYEDILKEIDILFDTASNLSQAIYRGLGGHKRHPLLSLLCKNKADYIAFQSCDGKLIQVIFDTEFFVNQAIIRNKPQTWPGTHIQPESVENLQFSSLIMVLEVYLTCLTVFLIKALFEKDAKMCLSLLHKDLILLESWNLLFGGSATLVYDPKFLTSCQYIVPKKVDNPTAISLDSTSHSSKLERKVSRFSSVAVSSSTNTSIPLGKVQTDIFIAPQITIVDHLLGSMLGKGMRDTKEEIDDNDSYDNEFNTDQSDSAVFRYGWLIMTAALLNNQAYQIRQTLQKLGFSTSRIFSYSSIIHSLLAFLSKLRYITLSKIDGYGNPPSDFIIDQSYGTPSSTDALNTSSLSTSVAILKKFIDPKNTPFQLLQQKDDANLWNTLVCCEHLQNEMLLFSFPVKKTINDITTRAEDNVAMGYNTRMDKSCATIFSSSESVVDFCYNHTNPTSFVVTTTSEISEINIAYGSITSVTDLTGISDTSNHISLNLFLEDMKLVPQNPANYPGKQPEVIGAHPISTPIIISKSMQRPSNLTNCMESHPSEPFYIASINESKVLLYQYGVKQSLHTFYNCQTKNSNAKVVQMKFNDYGSKFGVMDDCGGLALCLFNTHSSNAPYMYLNCHNKYGCGFTFLGSSSLIATAGHSHDGLDVCLWDTLLPKKNKLICSFASHEHGCHSVAYVPGMQSLIIGGRKGALFAYDLRQGKMLQSISQAHESSVNSMSVDNNLLATGSSDGVVKLWNLNKNGKSLELYKSYSDYTYVSNNRSLLTQVTRVRLSGRYLFASHSEGSLTLRNIDNETS